MKRFNPIPDLTPSETARFWRKVDKSGECWLWRGTIHHTGYGTLGIRGVMLFATRISWALANGRSPTLYICHTCDNPACVNPAHLWEGTGRDNVQDAIAKGRYAYQRVTHCLNGHPFDEQNTYMWGNRRSCRACNRARVARRKAERVSA